MTSNIKVDSISSKDSCQVIATGNSLQTTTVKAQSDNQSTAHTTSAEIPVRRTFEEQKPFIFTIIGIAIVYIGILIVSQVIKNRIAKQSLEKEEE